MNTSLITFQTNDNTSTSNQLDEVSYFNPKNKERLFKALNNNRKFEFLMFNLWRTRAVLYKILEENNFNEKITKTWGNQFHAVNNLIGILLDGTDWNQSIFVNNEPTEKF